MIGHENQKGPGRRLFQNLEEGIAGGGIHRLGIGDQHDPHAGLVWLHGKRLAECADLINFYEYTGWFDADDIRMIFRFNFPA